MYNIKYILNNALATTLADGMPSSRESGPQSLASSQVPNDSYQTAIRVLDDTIYYCWCMGTDLKLVPVLQEASRYITSNTLTISRPWRIITKITYGHLPGGGRVRNAGLPVITGNTLLAVACEYCLRAPSDFLCPRGSRVQPMQGSDSSRRAHDMAATMLDHLVCFTDLLAARCYRALR